MRVWKTMASFGFKSNKRYIVKVWLIESRGDLELDIRTWEPKVGGEDRDTGWAVRVAASHIDELINCLSLMKMRLTFGEEASSMIITEHNTPKEQG